MVLRPPAEPEDLTNDKEALLEAFPAGSFQLGHRYHQLALLAGEITPVGVRAIAEDKRVVRIGLDIEVRASLIESGALVHAAAVQALGFTGRGVTVAVLDTGIDTDHPDLSDNVASGAWHFLGAGSNTGPGAEDDQGHGTMVSSVITSRGLVAPLGLAPDTLILPIKVLDNQGRGWLSDWLAGIDHVVANRAAHANLAAINLSLGTDTTWTEVPCDNACASAQATRAAVQAARAAGILVVAASGNHAQVGAMPLPACVEDVTSVGAVYDAAFGTVTWSNCTDQNPVADRIVCITSRTGGLDLLAPGALVTVSALGGGVAPNVGGTSMASPVVAAGVALLRQAVPGLTPSALEAAFRSTGVAIADPALGTTHPRVDLEAALMALPRLEAQDACCVGQRVGYRLVAAASAGRAFVAAASLATSPTLDLGCGQQVALAPDALLLASLTVPSVFEGFQGTLDASGNQTLQVNLPAAAELVGLTFYLAFVTHDAALQEVSWPLAQTVGS